MRTSFNIPQELLKEAQLLSGAKTVTQALLIALMEYIQKKKSRQLLELKGSLKTDFDYKKLRRKR